MITFRRYKSDLYLIDADIPNPSQARVGFLFQDAARTDPTFQLTTQTWTNPNDLGFFAFFTPSARPDWDAFAQNLRTLFQANPGTQFGWFTEEGTVAAATLIPVSNQGTVNANVQSPFSFTFSSVTLQVLATVFASVPITFDDGSNTFQIGNPSSGGQSAARIVSQPPNQPSQTFFTDSPTLLLPLTGPQAASINVGLQLTEQDLTQFETGLMYFGPPPTAGAPLTALNYPVLRAPDGAPINFSAWLDVLQPLIPTRSYFQITDAQVGSYFASTAIGAQVESSVGRTFTLLTVNGGMAEEASRLVFANRPVQQTSDNQYYYLTPAGQFHLTVGTGVMAAATAPSQAGLLCGVTGTEFLNVGLSGNAPDTLTFVPGQAAFRLATPTNGAKGSAPHYLDSKATTSWVQFTTTTGSYISQPEQSPLYQQGKNTAAQLSEDGAPADVTVYLLDFLPLATWAPPNGTTALAGPATSPLVPMVPYAGMPPMNAVQLQPFLDMESSALNPTRRDAFTIPPTHRPEEVVATEAPPSDFAMTPQGLLAGLGGTPPVWQTLQIATSPAGLLQFQKMGVEIRQVLMQNQVFAVISTLGADSSLFNFDDSTINMADWLFDLSPAGTPSPGKDGKPPILILKFYPGQSIASLVQDTSQWSLPDTFNTDASGISTYLGEVIQQACEAVYGEGNCPDGVPSGEPDTDSLYYNFYQVVTDPEFSGVLAVNCNMQLNALPPAIRGVIGGMTKTVNGNTVSNIDAFRVHHVGVQINDTDPTNPTPTLTKSSLFGLVDYEKPAPTGTAAAVSGLDVFYNFEVEYLRALFINAELRNFSCQINLTINNLFTTPVELDTPPPSALTAAGDDTKNVIVVTGSYQAHSTSGEDKNSGQGVYSFVAEGTYTFTFAQDNPYLDTITLTKLQFTFQEETPSQSIASGGTTSRIKSRFAIWGSMVFKDLNVLDIFSFKQLSFADLGITVGFDLTTYLPPTQPTTGPLDISFSPGDLRFDLAQTTNRDSKTSLLSLLPFKLTSFIYSETADQTLESLNYFKVSSVPGLLDVKDTFHYGLLFDLDLGALGNLVGSLAAFKFKVLIGWLSGDDGGIAFGIQLPEANGKLEITIEGVLSLVIEQFVMKYLTVSGTGTPLDGQNIFVLALHNSYLELLGTRLPPGQALFDFALFAPTDNAKQIGWLAAINNQQPSGNGANGANGDNGDGVFQLVYLGGGQRVGPSPDSTPTTFQDFLTFMTGDFWTAFEDNDYPSVYHPEGSWLILSDIKLLKIIEVGFVFYDYTPFYSLTLNVEGYFNFEITYTKVSDTIGLFYANFTLPDTLRTFQVGAASLTLPAIGVSVYTNGNWKLDVGFPAGDDWSRSFRVEAQAGPVPVTGSGGFYIASLSSATLAIFKGTYPSILAFGFAARLGVGKDFTSGPLKAGISVTFFGIIEGAAGYLASGSTEIFQEPDALSLKGQFGVIGEIYGSIDFKIIKASVNVRLQASIGIQLQFERSIPGSEMILLYVEASVTLSVEVSIDLGLFSISISFSFNASFRFQWQLGGSSAAESLRLAWAARPALVASVTALCPGLVTSVPLWFLPELTVNFPDATSVGAPWFVGSLGIPYDPNPPAQPTYAQFKPFETVTAQLVTWALTHVLQISGCSGVVTQEQLGALDETPEILVGWIDYTALLGELSLFQVAISVPTGPDGTQGYATAFPMIPFLQVQTQGRLDGSGKAADLSYQYASKNPVSDTYLASVEEYFNQLFVNQTQEGQTAPAAAPDVFAPLVEGIFLDYFTGLIRGAVHQLLQTMQDEQLTSSPLDALMQKAVGGKYFATLAGQMSSSFRGGSRLPYVSGMTLPGGAPQLGTSPLYAILWQEFPVGQLSPNGNSSQYTIALTNPDTSQKWVTSSVNWALTSDILTPYQNLHPGDVVPPSTPVQLPFTNTGPQSFTYENPIVWTQPGNVTASLRPFPANLQRLQSTVTGAIDVLVQSRATGAAYLPGGTALPPNQFIWATKIQLSIKQVPGASGTDYLRDIYALSGASQQDQALLEQLLRLLTTTNPIAAIQVLYQTESGASGLNSATINAADVFALRTNTTTVSAPPAGPNLFLATAPPIPLDVSVGANIGDDYSFLQIIQQAVVTNAPGYYLRYKDAAGNSLPPTLFNGGPAPLTLLVTYVPDGTQNTPASPAKVQPYYNAIVLTSAQPGLLYYADTTDPALDTQYSAVAAGSVGVTLTRSDSAMKMRPHAALAAAHGLDASRDHTRVELVRSLVEAGVTDEASVRRVLVEAGAAPAQLNALYSLITYMVEQSTGFIESNLSAPIQPQQPNGTAKASNGTDIRTYRVFTPLYNLAVANQSLPPGTLPNRYASIGDPFAIDFYQNDAFGNQMPVSLGFRGTNYYFDPITPLDQWQGIVSAYDFLAGGKPQANTFTMYLQPRADAFTKLSAAQVAAALTLYETIQDQLTGPGISFYVETNLALQADGAMVQIALTQQQGAAVLQMIDGIVAYLQAASTNSPPFNVQAVPLTFTVTGAGDLPPAFEIAALFGIQRDPNLISPLLKDRFGNITFPSAQNVSTRVVPTAGAPPLSGSGPSVSITAFASAFMQAFPALALSVGLNGAQQPLHQPSSVSQTRERLAALRLPGDGSGTGQTGQQPLWAVQRALIDVTIGVGTAAGPRYLSPKPLDNTLNTGVVPLPTLPSPLPQVLPTQQLFTDVDLDVLNRPFFQAVDDMLQPAAAAQAFELVPDAYDIVARGRKCLAGEYARYEVDWLFPPNAPFSGTPDQLKEARQTFDQQMRAALMTAYAVDTIVQYAVTWNTPVPSSVGDRFSLFGQVQPTDPKAPKIEGFGLSTAEVPIVSSGPGLLTFLFGTSAVQDEAQVTLDLEYNVTHIEYYLEPASQTPPGEARPALWLQLVTPYPSAPPHVGPPSTPTAIPLVFRQYPTPPTVINQSAIAGEGTQMRALATQNPLTAAAAWQYVYAYQTQLTAHDLIVTAVTYNTDLSAASNGNNNAALSTLEDGPYNLFNAIARFNATYGVLQPILTTPTDPNWSAAYSAFAKLVTTVVQNTDWNPPLSLASGGRLINVTDSYVVTDQPQANNTQLISLTWSPQQGESSFPDVTLAIQALAPGGKPYPDQTSGKVPNGITDTYLPVPPLVDDWVIHQVTVDALNVLVAENALAGVQIERNLIEMTDPNNTIWTALSEFVYMTPLVRPSQPATPFIDNSMPIDVAKLPNQGASAVCPPSPSSLCQRIYTMMNDLIGNPEQVMALHAAQQRAGVDASAVRRVKVGCSFAYPVVAAAGGDVGLAPIVPMIPVTLARSFTIDGAQSSQISTFAQLYANAVADWSERNGVIFGANAQPGGGQLVFDVTLYAELSGVNTPVLRLRNLQLNTTDIDPVGAPRVATTAEPMAILPVAMGRTS